MFSFSTTYSFGSNSSEYDQSSLVYQISRDFITLVYNYNYISPYTLGLFMYGKTNAALPIIVDMYRINAGKVIYSSNLSIFCIF